MRCKAKSKPLASAFGPTPYANSNKMTTHHNIILHSPAGRPFSADVYYSADGKPKPVIIFLHGFKGFKDWGCWHLFAEAFAEAGFVFFKFNFSHNGVTIDKPAEFADLEAFGRNTYSKELSDLDHLISWLIEGHSPLHAAEMDAGRIGLIGHSRGGGIALIQAAADERVKAVATWAGVSSLAFMWEGNPALEAWKREGVTHIYNARTRQQMPVYFDLYEDYAANQPRLNVEHAMRHLHKPCLIVHGEADLSVSVNAARKLHEWNPSARLHIIPGADHVFGAQHPCTTEALPAHCLEVAEQSLGFFRASM